MRQILGMIIANISRSAILGLATTIILLPVPGYLGSRLQRAEKKKLEKVIFTSNVVLNVNSQSSFFVDRLMQEWRR